MKKFLLPMILCAALSSTANESIIQKLQEVNAEWKHEIDGQQIALTFNADANISFDDWIATHLMLVEQTLRQRSTQQLTHEQRVNRFRLLDELNAYWHGRGFPVNDYLTYKNPVFIDRKGNHCAVGFLMKQSGASSLAQEINAKQKFAYIREITVDGVASWANTNGFTMDELAWIQPGYPVAFTANDLERGLNGPVNCMITSPSNPAIYAGGEFSYSTKGVACSGVAMYINGIAGWDWIGIDGGVNGKVNALLLHNDELYVGGEFTMAGSTPAVNIAKYDLNTSQWIALGNFDAEVTSLAVYNNEIYAGGKFTGYVSKWDGNQWQIITQGFIYGEGVRTLEVWNNLLLIGGKFELATGALREHVTTWDGMQMGTLGFGTLTPVNDFEVFRNELYASCDIVENLDTCAVARLVNNDWEVVLKPFTGMIDYFDGTSIKKLLAADNQLFCAGSFFTSVGFMYGNNIMKLDWNLSNEPVCTPLIITDDAVNTLGILGNTICFGGAFVTAGDTLNYIGQFSNSMLGIDDPEMDALNLFDVYPNPANSQFTVRIKEFSAGMELRIFDVTGKVILRKEIISSIMPVDISIARGIYMVQVTDDEKVLGAEKVSVN